MPLALVTGASSGIGRAFASRLAAQRYSLILTARRVELLDQLAGKLREGGVEVTVIPADLSTEEGIARLEQAILQRPLDLLINNAGFGVKGNLVDTEIRQQLDMIQVHIIATVRLCRAALPAMLQQRRGAIINVASVAAFIPMPGNANYAASKAYLVTFSEALQAEVKSAGVTVQALCPGFTYSGFHDTPEYRFDRGQVPRILWMGADEVVDASLKSLRRRAAICIPGLHNKLLLALTRRTPLGPLIMRALRSERGRSVKE